MQRIDKTLGGPSAEVPDAEIRDAVAVASASQWQVESEITREEDSLQVGKPFVKNGSRDRWGNLRTNVGGRPKKRARPGERLPSLEGRIGKPLAKGPGRSSRDVRED